MKSNQKGFIGVVLIILIALVTVGGGVYFYTQNKEVSMNSDPTNIEMNSWKTYENKSLNFKIKYPATYQIDSINSTNSRIRFYDTEYKPRPESDDYSSSVTIEYVPSNNTNNWRAVLEKQFPGAGEFRMNSYVLNPEDLKFLGVNNSVKYDISLAFLGVDGYAFSKDGYDFFVYEVPKDDEGKAVFKQLVSTLELK